MFIPRLGAEDCDPDVRSNSIHRGEHPQPVVSRQQRTHAAWHSGNYRLRPPSRGSAQTTLDAFTSSQRASIPDWNI
jgi:hypothetical protein